MDLQLLAIDPRTRQVVVAQGLAGSQYGELAGVGLAEPAATQLQAAPAALEAHWRDFIDAESARAVY